MIELLSFGWPALTGFLLLTLRRRERAAPQLAPATIPGDVRVSVIVPARDEARSIRSCVASLLDQDHAGTEIIVVDDASSDGTAAIAAALGVTVVPAGPMPAGWVGKAHACAVGAAVASGDWLVFVDADTVAAPGLVSAAVGHARVAELDVVSPHPFQEVVSFWERVVVPAGFFLLAATRDVRRINDPRRRAGAVNGQCIVVRTAAYRTMGGHRAVRGEILEDVAFGRLAKRRGLRLELLDGSRFIRTRMYRSFVEIWRGLTKNAALVAGGPVLALPASVGLVAFAAAPVGVPVLAAAAGSPWAAGAALAGSGLFCLLAMRGPRFFGLRRGWGLTLPLGLLVAGTITAASALKSWRGTREWKGRSY